jgi:hypothetical protein
VALGFSKTASMVCFIILLLCITLQFIFGREALGRYNVVEGAGVEYVIVVRVSIDNIDYVYLAILWYMAVLNIFEIDTRKKVLIF